MSIWDKERTICWECAKTCGDCSWSEKFEPVEGWEAVKTVNGAGEESYLVRKCPEFVQETREKSARKMDTDGCLLLVERLLEVARDDYIKGDEKTKNEIERFVRGKGASKVHMITDPDNAIKKMKSASDEYKRKEEAKNIIKALEDVVKWLDLHKNTIQEAVSFMEDQKPKKPVTDKYMNKVCPRCNSRLRGRYCSECGQEIKTDE